MGFSGPPEDDITESGSTHIDIIITKERRHYEGLYEPE